MNVITLDDIKQLFRKLIIPFHEIERDMTLPVASHRPDNDAEHSWSLSFLAVCLAPEIDPDLDVGKVSIFATIHDIVEIYAGDTSVFAAESFKASKSQREAEARAKLKVNFPKFPKVFDYLDEYEQRISPEAKFVYALDKFINRLTIIEDNGHYYTHIHKITKQQCDEALKGHREKAHVHPKIGEYYDELRVLFDADPNHFYQG